MLKAAPEAVAVRQLQGAGVAQYESARYTAVSSRLSREGESLSRQEQFARRLRTTQVDNAHDVGYITSICNEDFYHPKYDRIIRWH
jgi:hypothetical protein